MSVKIILAKQIFPFPSQQALCNLCQSVPMTTLRWLKKLTTQKCEGYSKASGTTDVKNHSFSTMILFYQA